MTKKIDHTTGSVLELGPGTGAFTEALLRCGLAREQLTLVELDERFADLLSGRFPSARIVQGSAARLSAAGIGRDVKYDAVISGLPLLSIPSRTVFRIVRGVARRLGPLVIAISSPMVFGVLLHTPCLGGWGLEANFLGAVMWNFPPASVYRISRPRADPRDVSHCLQRNE